MAFSKARYRLQMAIPTCLSAGLATLLAMAACRFDGPSLPDLRTGLALKMIADYRNLVAHGEEDAATVAGLQPVDAVHRLIDQIDGLAVHVYDAAVDSLDNRRYLR